MHPQIPPVFSSPIIKSQRDLPHWKKDNAIYWITFRLADSLPQKFLQNWKQRRRIWLKNHPKPWTESIYQQYLKLFYNKIETWLDSGLGSCVLVRTDVREIVQECLMRFHKERLTIHSAVIMPNHVHVLLEPFSEYDLSDILKGIKGASARSANKLLRKTGQFWSRESYDHIVRNKLQYDRLIHYIKKNPAKAKLKPNQYWLKTPI